MILRQKKFLQFFFFGGGGPSRHQSWSEGEFKENYKETREGDRHTHKGGRRNIQFTGRTDTHRERMAPEKIFHSLGTRP